MSTLKKIITAIRGGTREIGEEIAENQGKRIFEQEIEQATQSLNQAKHDLTDVMAKEMQAGREMDALDIEITKHEQLAADALQKSDESLALTMATKVAGFEAEKSALRETKVHYAEHVDKIKRQMERTERELTEYERQLTMVNTTENIHKATATITNNYKATNTKLLSAKASLARIRQAEEEAMATTQTVMSEAKQQMDSVTEDASQAILARIKQKHDEK